MSSSENSPSNSYFPGDELYNVGSLVLKPCHICGRTFNPTSLERHEKTCEKSKKCIRRNVFNSFSQRVKEIGGIPISNDAKDEDRKKCRKGKEEHEYTGYTTKREKKSDSHLMNNGLSHQKKAPLGYQQCPSCNRCFNSKAADRHIAWCMEQRTRLPKTPPSSEAMKRLKARIKYQAPLPKRKEVINANMRLVKSADSLREPSLKRTHSSPSIPVKDIRISRYKSMENCSIPLMKPISPKKTDQSAPIYTSCNSSQEVNQTEMNIKKAVKFKEIFPVYKKERNKNLDMLAALKLRLSELEMSDDSFIKSNENAFNSNQPKHNFMASRDMWTSDGEAHSSPSSSSEGSLPSLSRGGSSEPRMPRFCYNCGTKYPIVSAKYCCECGARRFVFGENNNLIYA